MATGRPFDLPYMVEQWDDNDSDPGDDKNDGRTRETAIYSWTRAIKLCDGNAEAHLMQGDATLQRLAQEIERQTEAARTRSPSRS
jgi:hypothetical protein